MAEPAKFDVVLELADLSHSGLEVSSSSLLAFLEGVTTAYRHGERGNDRGVGGHEPSPCDDHITLNFQLVVDRSAKERSRTGPPAPDLTRRQTEIAYLLERGLTNKEIANKLNISPATVKNHVHAILGKLEVDRRSKVAAYLRSRPALVVSTPGAAS
jgi:DNA-binding NarL/FixJ family response regulator